MWGIPMKRLAVILGAMIVSASAFAAGVDSRSYTCVALHGLVTAQRFVFINNPNFEDFIVVDASYCGGGGSAQLQRRSVPTTDTPECLVNYCTTHDIEGRTGGGGGM
jgi:hypothetical protein